MWVENNFVNPAEQDHWIWVDDSTMNPDDYYSDDWWNYYDDGSASTTTTTDNGPLQFGDGASVVDVDPFANDGVNADANWWTSGDGFWINQITGEIQDDYGNFYGYQDSNVLGGDASPITVNADGSFYDSEGNLFDADGNFLGNDNPNLTPRDGSNGGTEIIRPTDIPNGSGGNWFSGLLSSLGNLFKGGVFTATAGSGASGVSPGGSAGSQQQQMQRALQEAQQQGAPASVLNALRSQIAAAQRAGTGGMSITQTLLIAAAVGGIVYLAARPKSNAT